MGYQALVHHRINQRLTSRFLNVDELKDWSGSMLMSRGMQFDWQFSNASPPLLTHVMEVCHPRRCPLFPSFQRVTPVVPGRILLTPRFRF
jgi:hypothetical protein